MTVKMKLMTVIAAFLIVLAVCIIAVFAASSASFTITGSIIFEVDNQSLFLQDVRVQQNLNEEPKSLQGFDKGFINGEYCVDMSTQQFSSSGNGTFLVYFDIVNYVHKGVNTLYKAEAVWTGSPVSGVSFRLRDGSERIEQATIYVEDATDNDPVSGTLILEVSATTASTFDMSNITIAINESYTDLDAGLHFDINEDAKTATLTKYDGTATDLALPATFSKRTVGGVSTLVEGGMYTVTAIAGGSASDNAFSGAASLQSVTLPDTLESIGAYAFYNRTGLAGELKLPKGLKTIGNYAFGGCTGLLGTLNLPATLTSTGTGAFQNCTGLTKLNFASGSQISAIGSSSFNGCSGLTGSLTLPDSVTTIGQSAFRGTGFTGTLKIPSSVSSLGASAFRDCAGFTQIAIEDGLTNIAESTFTDCAGAYEVRLPSTMRQIGTAAFSGCANLRVVYVASSTIAGLLTSKSACGNLLQNAVNVYVSTSASTSLPSEFLAIFSEATSQVSGYKKYE